MTRLSTTNPNAGSLFVGEGSRGKWRKVEFVWDINALAFYISDTRAKKRYGPFKNVIAAKEDGYNIVLDGGSRAEYAEKKTALEMESVA